MPTPFDTFAASWEGVPPGMPAGDLVVWRQFHATAARWWDSIAYDVEIRDGAWPIVSTDPTMQKMWMRNTSRRIDALAWRGNVTTILEVRHAAAWQSMGQIIGYTNLWRSSYPNIPVVAVMLVTDTIPADIRQVAASQGIYTWTPGELTAPARPLQIMPEGTTLDAQPFAL